MSPTHSTTEEEPKKPMAVSHPSTALPVERTPTLPPIRELLPDHVHGQAGSASYRPHYHAAASTSSSYQEWTGKPELMTGSGQLFSPPSTPRSYGPSGETAPRSILNDHIQPRPSLPPQQPGRDNSIPHFASSHFGSMELKQTLPPIRDLQARREEIRSYPLGYEQNSGPDTRPRNQPLHMAPPTTAASISPAAKPARLYPQSSSPSQYASYQQSYAAEPDYTPPHLVPPYSPSSSMGITGGDVGDSRHKKRRGNLPKPVTDILRAWFHAHLDHPYPSEEDKQMFITRTGLTISQISNWFINARRRQLPALRNQARAADSGKDTRQESPMSEGEESASLPSDMSPPHR